MSSTSARAPRAAGAPAPPAEHVCAVVRVRPRAPGELPPCVRVVGACDVAVAAADDGPDTGFAFDAALASDAGEDAVWLAVGAPLLAAALGGYNVCLFAYGQTGSGKTHTMLGGADGASRGIVPRLCDALFAGDGALPTKVELSVLEVCREQVHDLLVVRGGSSAPPAACRVRHGAGGVFVEGLTRAAVGDAARLDAALRLGLAARAVGSTRMNAASSRAHTVVELRLTLPPAARGGAAPGAGGAGASARVTLIDLAGSERARSTGATGERLKEGAATNLSLHALGNVIAALVVASAAASASASASAAALSTSATASSTSAALRPPPPPRGAPAPVHIPFRDSVLTTLLEGSLGGNARAVVLACVSPAPASREESIATLRFADRAKAVRVAPRVNVDEPPPAPALVAALRAEVDALRAALAAAASAAAAGAAAAPPAAAAALARELEGERAAGARAAADAARRLADAVAAGERAAEAAWAARLAETTRRVAAGEAAAAAAVAGGEAHARLLRARAGAGAAAAGAARAHALALAAAEARAAGAAALDGALLAALPLMREASALALAAGSQLRFEARVLPGAPPARGVELFVQAASTAPVGAARAPAGAGELWRAADFHAALAALRAAAAAGPGAGAEAGAGVGVGAGAGASAGAGGGGGGEPVPPPQSTTARGEPVLPPPSTMARARARARTATAAAAVAASDRAGGAGGAGGGDGGGDGGGAGGGDVAAEGAPPPPPKPPARPRSAECAGCAVG